MDSGVTKDSNVSQTAGRWGWGQRVLGLVVALVLWAASHPLRWDVVALELVSTCWWVRPNPGVNSCPVAGGTRPRV